MAVFSLAQGMNLVKEQRLLTGTIISPNKHNGRQGVTPSIWIFHDMEAPERSGIAKNVAQFFSRSATKAATHFSVDNREVWQSAETPDTAWHAPGYQRETIGVEHAGYARQIRAEWLDPFGIEMLDRSARLFAVIGYGVYGMQPVHLTVAEIRAIKAGNTSKKGIATHWDITKATNTKGGHYDPGPHFPMDYYLERCRYYVGLVNSGQSVPSLNVPAPIVADRVLRQGYAGIDVEGIQRALNAFAVDLGFKPLVLDGDFGPATLGALEMFQRWAGIEVDGIVGPQTRQALADAKPGTSTVVPQPPKTAENIGLRYLGKGDTGDAVKAVQAALNARGANLVVDGDFGRLTDLAVRALQTGKGLASDGIVGPITWGALLPTA